jgi:hypothetical protein
MVQALKNQEFRCGSPDGRMVNPNLDWWICDILNCSAPIHEPAQ